MFRNDAQRCLVCQALLCLGGGRLPGLWEEGRPTKEAVDLLGNNGATLSAGERVLLLLCWCMWDNNDTLSVSELLRLDRDKERAVGELIVARATGEAAIDAWIARYQV